MGNKFIEIMPARCKRGRKTTAVFQENHRTANFIKTEKERAVGRELSRSVKFTEKR